MFFLEIDTDIISWFGALSISEDYGVDAKHFLVFGRDQLGNDQGIFSSIFTPQSSGCRDLKYHKPSGALAIISGIFV